MENCFYVPLPFGYVSICKIPPPPVPGPDLPELDLPDLPPLTGPARPGAITPGARVESRALERTRDDVCTTGCSACIAAASGYPDWVSYQNNKDKPVAGTASRGYAYQAFVSGLPHEPENRRNMEWQWAAYSWDGIEVPNCTMLEAKYGYDIFVPYDGAGPTVLPEKRFLLRPMFKGMINQLTKQLVRTAPFSPEVKLKWVFSHPNPMTYFQTLANAGGKVGWEVEYRPFE
ncbi:MAG: Tox-REase-5 domain-containing protein [Paracoccaceae bacterium]